MNTSNDLNIIIIGNDSCDKVLDILSQSASSMTDSNLFRTFIIASDQFRLLGLNYNFNLEIRWIHPPLLEPMGREWWKLLQLYPINCLFVLFDHSIKWEYYEGLLQNLYTRFLENLDPDPNIADMKARKQKIFFLLFYKYRSVIVDDLNKFHTFFLKFSRNFTLAKVFEYKVDINSLEKSNFLDILGWCTVNK
ncbi:MAG: hypothetical protein ACFFD1_04035 [Candidatus Thorarchaeota archaeon]